MHLLTAQESVAGTRRAIAWESATGMPVRIARVFVAVITTLTAMVNVFPKAPIPPKRCLLTQ